MGTTIQEVMSNWVHGYLYLMGTYAPEFVASVVIKVLGIYHTL